MQSCESPRWRTEFRRPPRKRVVRGAERTGVFWPWQRRRVVRGGVESRSRLKFVNDRAVLPCLGLVEVVCAAR